MHTPKQSEGNIVRWQLLCTVPNCKLKSERVHIHRSDDQQFFGPMHRPFIG